MNAQRPAPDAPPARSAVSVRPIVIWFGRVGDMILLTTLLDILHRRYGNPCTLIGAGSWTREIYRTHPDVAQTWVLRRYTVFFLDLAWWRAFWALRRNGTDPVYICEFDERKLARIRRLLAWSGVDPNRCVFLLEQPAYAESHWVDRLIALSRVTPQALRASDYPWPSGGRLGPRLAVAAHERRECDAWIRERGWSGRPIILVQPGNRRTMRGRALRVSDDDPKAWPIERWSELLRRVHARMPSAVILLCGAPRETLLLSWIREATPLEAVVTAEIPLGRLLALCQVAHDMISVDTGPAHAAAALGLPLLVLFGALAQSEWGPRSSSGSPVVGVGGPPVSRRLDEISVDTVYEAWLSLLAQMEPAQGAHGTQAEAG